MITKLIQNQWKIAKERGWDRIYWLVDLHGTVIRSNYVEEITEVVYYPHALDTMRILSSRPDIVLIMYTCSWPHEIEKYQHIFKRDNIDFKYINTNPEVSSEKYGCFDHKPYGNIFLDDKAGFDPDYHWQEIKSVVKSLPILEG